MSFHDVQFPTDISYGSSGGPVFSTVVIETESGAEHRVSRWNDPRHQYDAVYGIRDHEDIARVKEFFIARKGKANAFRWKDWTDYTSNPTDPSFAQTAGTADQILGVGDGTVSTFQLCKSYNSGPVSYVRKIEKPVEGTVRIWLNGVEQLSGWSVNTDSGLITFTSPPSNTVVVAASFQFDVPVRFMDDDLLAKIDNWSSGSLSIGIIEIVDPASSNVDEFYYGQSGEMSFAASISLTTKNRDWKLSATAGGLTVALPDRTNIPTGDRIFYITNAGSNTFTLKDELGSTLATLSAGQMVEVILSKTSLGAKVWYAS